MLEQQEPTKQKSVGISSDRLNFILALCAILISGASFYATYLQANSAEKQVKAMTLPLLQFEHGNYDKEKDLRAIYFDIKNAGVGPAIIKNTIFKYKGSEYNSLNQFLSACCTKEIKEYEANTKSISTNYNINTKGGEISAPLLNVIIPGQSTYNFKMLYDGELTNSFWDKLDDERFNTQLKLCYCSLLDECYTTEQNGVVEQVDMCPLTVKP